MIETAEQRKARLYEESVGKDAFARQREAARIIHPCCGWRRDQGHHPLCVNAPK